MGLGATAWQGWLSILIYITVILAATLSVMDMPEDGFPAEFGIYMIVVWITTTALIIVSYKHGPAPKWRWGKSDSDNPSEDL